MSIMRRCAHAALALVLSVFAIAPHQHEGLRESLVQETVTAQIGKCETPQTRHFHAARSIHEHPCVACARQHSAGAMRSPAAPFKVLPATRTFTVAVSHRASAIVVFTPLRAPPA